MMDDIEFYIKDGILYRIVSDGGIGRVEPVITKDAFIACYDAWIKDGDDNADCY